MLVINVENETAGFLNAIPLDDTKLTDERLGLTLNIFGNKPFFS